MEKEDTIDSGTANGFVRKAEEVLDLIEQNFDLFLGSILVIVVGVFAIYLIHKVAARFLFPHISRGRTFKAFGVSIYALILLITALIVLGGIGVDVRGIGHVALAIIFIVAVLTFFILPFLPRLPYQIGHLIEARGELGTVTAISPLFTTLRKFDGALVFMPNTSIMSMNIRNHSHISRRLVEFNLRIQNDNRLKLTKETLVRIMTEDERVLQEPSGPTVYVTNANAVCIDLYAVCWVNNKDWFRTKSDLWEKIIVFYSQDIPLAKPWPELGE